MANTVAPVPASTVTEVLSQTNPDVNLIFEAAGYSNITGLSSAQSQALINSLSALFNTAYAVYQKIDINSGAQLTQIFNNYTASLKQAQTALAGLSAVSSASDVQNVINLISANNATSVMGTAVQLLAVVVYNYDHNKMFVQLTGAKLVEPLTNLPMFTDKLPAGENESDYVVNFFVNMFAQIASLLEQAYAAASSSLTPAQKANVTAINNAIAAINAAAVSLNNVVASTSKQISTDQAAYIAQMTTPANSVTAYNNGIAKISQDYAPLYGASGEVQTQIKAVAAAQQVVTTNLAQLGSALTTYQSQTINSNLAAANKTFTQALSTANTQFPSGLPSTLTYTTAQNYSTSVPGAAVIALYNQQQTASKPTTSDLATALNNAVATATAEITSDQTTQINAIDNAKGSQASLTAAINAVNATYKSIMNGTDPSNFATALAAANAVSSKDAALTSAIQAANIAFPAYPAVDLTVTTAAVAPYATSVPGMAIAAFQTEASKDSTPSTKPSKGGLSKGATAGIAVAATIVGGFLVAAAIALYLKLKSSETPAQQQDPTKDAADVEAALQAGGASSEDAANIGALSEKIAENMPGDILPTDFQQLCENLISANGNMNDMRNAVNAYNNQHPSDTPVDLDAVMDQAASFYGMKNCGISPNDTPSLESFSSLVDSYNGVNGVNTFSDQLTSAKTLLEPYITNGSTGGRPNVQDILKFGNDSNAFGEGSKLYPDVEPGSPQAIQIAADAVSNLKGPGGRALSPEALASELDAMAQSPTAFSNAVSVRMGEFTPTAPAGSFVQGAGTESWVDSPAFGNLANIQASDSANIKAQIIENLKTSPQTLQQFQSSMKSLEDAIDSESLTPEERAKAQAELDAANEIADENPEGLFTPPTE